MDQPSVEFEVRPDGLWELEKVTGVAVGYSEQSREVGLVLRWGNDDPERKQFAFTAEKAGELGAKLVEAATKAGWSPSFGS